MNFLFSLVLLPSPSLSEVFLAIESASHAAAVIGGYPSDALQHGRSSAQDLRATALMLITVYQRSEAY